jgi:hypothetical protein
VLSRLQSLLELLQSDLSDEERTMIEDELFKHGCLEEVDD